MCYKSNRDAALLEVRLKSTGILCLHVFSKSGYTFERGGGDLHSAQLLLPWWDLKVNSSAAEAFWNAPVNHAFSAHTVGP